MRGRFCAVGSIFVLMLIGCTTTPYALVSHKKPHLTGPPGSGTLAAAEQSLTRAIHQERAKPLVALGDCLEALQFASEELKRNSGNATAVRDYNFGVSRIFQIIHDANLDPWTQPLTVPIAHGDFVLTYKPDPRPEWNPALFEFTPADEFDVGGKYVTERTTRDGLGAAIVAVEREASANRRQKLAPSRIFRTVTAVAQFQGFWNWAKWPPSSRQPACDRRDFEPDKTDGCALEQTTTSHHHYVDTAKQDDWSKPGHSCCRQSSFDDPKVVVKVVMVATVGLLILMPLSRKIAING
jgi:hypothetical protein